MPYLPCLQKAVDTQQITTASPFNGPTKMAYFSKIRYGACSHKKNGDGFKIKPSSHTATTMGIKKTHSAYRRQRAHPKRPNSCYHSNMKSSKNQTQGYGLSYPVAVKKRGTHPMVVTSRKTPWGL